MKTTIKELSKHNSELTTAVGQMALTLVQNNNINQELVLQNNKLIKLFTFQFSKTEVNDKNINSHISFDTIQHEDRLMFSDQTPHTECSYHMKIVRRKFSSP